MSKIVWLWHEPSNTMALADMRGGLPLITICDEYVGINPFYSYPLAFLLNYYGWIEIGEL